MHSPDTTAKYVKPCRKPRLRIWVFVWELGLDPAFFIRSNPDPDPGFLGVWIRVNSNRIRLPPLIYPDNISIVLIFLSQENLGLNFIRSK